MLAEVVGVYENPRTVNDEKKVSRGAGLEGDGLSFVSLMTSLDCRVVAI